MDCRTCKIIELAMLTVEKGEIIEEYDKFVNIGENLSPKVIDLTGITNDLLREEGVDEGVIAEDLKNRLTEDTLMIAHNCQFDLFFVYHLLFRHYPDDAYDIVSNVKWIDTVTVLKDRKDYPHKLCDAVEHYELGEVNFHRAIDDTMALYKVTLKMKEDEDNLSDYINLFGFNPKWGPGTRMPFIEYKSQPYHNRGLLPRDEMLPER